MEKEKLHTPEHEHQESKPKRIVQAGASVKPTTFAVGGKVFEMADFIGVTARTIKERLKKSRCNRWHKNSGAHLRKY